MYFTVNDQRVFAATGGRPFDAQAPCVVFLHGTEMDHSIWVMPSRWFARHGYGVLALDLPGHGRSEGPLLPTIEAMADWLIAVLDSLGVERAGLAGHSMGSLIALDAAGRYPDRARALALLGTSFPMPVNEQLLAAAKAEDHLALEMLNIYGHARSALLGGNEQIGMWNPGLGIRLMEQAAPGVVYNDLNACNAYQGGLEAARAVRCPATLIMGERDLLTPLRNVAPLREALADARLVTLPDCGHSLFNEKPDATLDALIGALCVAEE
ncbi:MAG: alpha/beta hydrolase [Gammaproteobacteria bacterium]